MSLDRRSDPVLRWFYSRDKQKLGPVPLARLKELAEAGEVRREPSKSLSKEQIAAPLHRR
jgi:hypothetical protein